MTVLPPASQLVTVFGGSGFLGRHVVRALARRGYRVRAAVRRPDLAGFLQPLGIVGQVTAVQANLRYPDSVAAAVKGADAVINLVGIMREKSRQNFSSVQAQGARTVAQACAQFGVDRLIQVSALGADAESISAYARSKAEGEAAAHALVKQAIVLRPSVMFGPEDTFFNRFASLVRMLPVLPLAGAETKFQPVFVGDVAEAIARAVDGKVEGGKVYELGGPEVKTLRELVDYVCEVTGRKRLIAPMPFGLARLQGQVLELADMLTLGLLPNELILTRDQVSLLQSDNVVSMTAEKEGRTLHGLGINPVSAEAEVPGYLWRFRKAGQFATARAS
ncbi:MAG: complex I NDUFA9 subunit family protein [Bosea sp.]|uniref:complex I NDUFA9 subunit family protein n=1 Tax=Bosea sp. (in: a-proteobacteria) TaxID=1871050 RepID=UPI00238CF3EE|nr:complex I NDUFA9 subunit family protein [Bosea sp. (in: a-proteobacteria)]MCP4739753.1 complex I NDUFA9 subunit family protein [Bosea sp. (in: a-proteobacteria)]